MSRYQIPKHAGPFYLITTKAGTPAVWNKKTCKGKILIPCKDDSQAQAVLKKLENVKDGGEIRV
jgi:hypothetical protein